MTISAEGKSIKCHQEILSACSSWFERTLVTVEPHEHPIIILKDVTFRELDHLINFMYSGEAIVPQQGIQSFLKTAEMLEIKGLLENSESATNSKHNLVLNNGDESSSNSPSKTLKQCELTVTTKNSDKSETNNYNLVIYNQMNMNNPAKSGKSNPLMKAYEANNKRKSSESQSQSENKKSSRSYEANAPVYDNRHLYPVDLVQPHFEYSGKNIQK